MREMGCAAERTSAAVDQILAPHAAFRLKPEATLRGNKKVVAVVKAICA